MSRGYGEFTEMRGSAGMRKGKIGLAITQTVQGIDDPDSMPSSAHRRWAYSIRSGSWVTESRLSAYAKIFLGVYTFVYVLWVIRFRTVLTGHQTPIGVDFVTFWAASRMALSGHAADVYQLAKIHPVEKLAAPTPDVGVFGWYYPPPFLLVVLPLALLPYLLALAVWISTTATANVSVLRKMVPWRHTVWLALAFPGTWINFLNGQNGFLSAALLGGGLVFLETQPVLAGVLFGGLIFKPQHALFVPLALVFARKWRALAVTGLTAMAFVAATLLVFGTDVWRAFFHSLPLSRMIVLDRGMIPYAAQQSVFAAMRLWGAPVRAAYAIQGFSALAAASLVGWLWRGDFSFRLKYAALVLCGLLATPYLFDYDLTLLGLPIAWIAVEGAETAFVSFEKSFLAFAWMSPILDRVLATHLLLPLAPIVNVCLLALVLIRTRTRGDVSRQ
jgi:alpha-1,2-mannosyltransferase